MTVEQRILTNYGLKKSDLTEELWDKVQKWADSERYCRRNKIPPLTPTNLLNELSQLAEKLNKNDSEQQNCEVD